MHSLMGDVNVGTLKLDRKYFLRQLHSYCKCIGGKTILGITEVQIKGLHARFSSADIYRLHGCSCKTACRHTVALGIT